MTFPNAIVRTSQIEADYWLNPANKSKAPAFLSTFFDAAIASVAPYVAAGRFKPFRGDVDLDPGIRAIALPGHTPGHTGYLVESESKDLLVWGDIVHVASIQLQNPKASVEYDTDAAAAQRSRRYAFELAAKKHYLVGAAHIAFPGLGTHQGRTAPLMTGCRSITKPRPLNEAAWPGDAPSHFCYGRCANF